MNSHTPQDRISADAQLERLIDSVLRDQPLRQAPPTLERRVLAALERRAARPWWHSSFAHWPRAARAAFLLATAAFAAGALRATGWLLAPLDDAARGFELPPAIAWIHALYEAFGSILQHMPALWVYGALALIVTLYVALFGISATAYRALYVSR